MVDERRGQAGRQGVEHKFHRVRPFVLSEEHRRLACIQHEGRGPDRVLLTRAVETLDRRPIVPARDPLILRAELKRGQARILLHGLNRRSHSIHIDSVNDSAHGCL